MSDRNRYDRRDPFEEIEGPPRKEIIRGLLLNKRLSRAGWKFESIDGKWGWVDPIDRAHYPDRKAAYGIYRDRRFQHDLIFSRRRVSPERFDRLWMKHFLD